MPNKYSEAHKVSNLRGPGDARPTALQIIEDENLVGKLPDKVFIVTGASAGIGPETGRLSQQQEEKYFSQSGTSKREKKHVNPSSNQDALSCLRWTTILSRVYWPLRKYF
jgi:hypothetical protein